MRQVSFVYADRQDTRRQSEAPCTTVHGGALRPMASSRRAGTSRRTSVLQSGFVVAEFALALPLLFGAALLLNSFLRLQRVDPGFDATSTLTFEIGLPRREYVGRPRIAATHQAIVERLSALPGWEPVFPERQFLSEFPMRVPKAAAVNRKLARKGILGGLDVGRWHRELKGVLTFTCTEVNDPGAIDELVEAVSS